MGFSIICKTEISYFFFFYDTEDMQSQCNLIYMFIYFYVSFKGFIITNQYNELTILLKFRWNKLKPISIISSWEPRKTILNYV